VLGEISIAPVDALWPDCLRVEIGRENAEHAVYMRQIGPVLVELAL
jgi:hypothetical protein